MPRILVVDDDQAVRVLLRKILEPLGYNVMEAENGRLAMEIQRRMPCDLLITDLLMPEKDGIELICEFKQLFPDTHIIAISGGGIAGPESYLVVANVLGAEKVYTKPVSKNNLLSGVEDLLVESCSTA